MILIGQYDSPFVRRVAVTLQHYDMPYKRRVISVYGDFERMLAVNPLGKVPALLLDSGEVLVDSQMILDHLDEAAGPERALTPPAGAARRHVLRRIAVALGMAEKAVALRVELFRRAPGTTDPAWAGRLEQQILTSLGWLEGEAPGVSETADPWLSGRRMMQDDVTAATAHCFLANKLPELIARQACPKLERLAARCEALPCFQAVPFMEA